MTRYLRSLLLCLALTPAFAAAPDSLAGFFFVDTRTDRIGLNYQSGFVLHADGTFSSVFSATTLIGRPTYENGGVSEGGTWTYRRVDENRGSLTLDHRRSQPAPEGFSLRFTSDFAGEVENVSENFPTRTFRAGPFVAAPLANCSNVTAVTPTTAALTGFVIAGPASRTVLVRAIGPSLQAFGVAGALADPQLRILRGNVPVATSAGLGDSVRRSGELVGAFPLATGARDAALVIDLPAGAYTAEVSARTAGNSGPVLIEVYMLP